MAAQGMGLEVTPAAKVFLGERGYDPTLGARPLRRLIEDVVVAPLAVRMAGDPGLRDRPIGVVTAAEAARADAGTEVIALPT